MMTPSRKSKYGSVCSEIAHSISNENGFVRVCDLANVLNVQIVGRPLLVEGMLARPTLTGASDRMWKVFFNSERFGVSTDAVSNETQLNPLSERLRFTLAHEFAHTLSFRADTFGLNAATAKRGRSGQSETTRDLEEEANFMASILLVADRSLKIAFEATPNQTLSALIALKQRLAVSREVLISKLHTLRSHDRESLLNTNSLHNRIVGLGTWKNRNSAQIAGWPCLVNFGNNLVPEFIYKTLAGEFVNLAEMAPPDFEFLEEGTLKFESVFRCGTHSNPSTDSSRFEIEIEAVSRRSNSSFMFVITPRED